MAKELSNKFTANLGGVISNAITAIKNARSREQARKESEFQKAIATGMSYKDQVKFREKQLKDESSSSFSDPEYIETLTTSIVNTRKLARFENIRIKYKQSLDDYVAGKKSIGQHIGVLEDVLSTEQDPEKRQEIGNLLSAARTERYTIESSAIKNRSILAQKDTSIPLLEASISEVQSKRAVAAINENDDEVAAWDDTLLSLRSAKSKLFIENGLNEITYQTNRFNLKSADKLGLYNNYIAEADASSPVIYQGVTYPSLKAYWESKRGEYIAGSYLDEVKQELDVQTSSIASTNAYGQIPLMRIQAVNEFYNSLKNKPEFALFFTQIEQARIDSVTGMANNLYTSLIDEANAQDTPEAYARAERAITGVENGLGIRIARPAFDSEIAAGRTIAGSITAPNKPTAVSTPPFIVQESTTTAPKAPSATITKPAPLRTPSLTTPPAATTTPSALPTMTKTPSTISSIATTTPPQAPAPTSTPVPPQAQLPPVIPAVPHTIPNTPQYAQYFPQFNPTTGVGTTARNPRGDVFRFNEQLKWEQIANGAIPVDMVPGAFTITPPKEPAPVKVDDPNLGHTTSFV